MKYNKALGNISKIQRYSTKDGPGIRSTVFFKGCSMNCIWCANPELINPNPELMETIERCLNCGNRNCIRVSNKTFDISNKKWETDINICKNDVFEVAGGWINKDELITELVKDKVFYDTSGGGVTFSGGEAALQAEFIEEVAKELANLKIHLTLDTSGYIPWKKLKKILPYFNLVLYDIKAYDSNIHKTCTDVDNQLILKNAERISELNIPMNIRLIVVPGYNDSENDIDSRLKFIRKLKSVRQVDILNFHQYGAKKYVQLNKQYKLKDLKSLDDIEITKIRKMAALYNFITTIGG